MTHERYTHGHVESVLRSHRWRTARNSAAYLLPELAPGLALLDVGAGPGSITADLAELVAPGRVVGVDASAEVIAMAQADHAGIAAPVEWLVADAYSLPFADGTFDVVHAHQVLQHLADPVAALVEMRRVARPEGIIAVRESDYDAMVWYPEDPGLDLWREVYAGVTRINGGEPNAGRHLLAWAHAAGFTTVDASVSAWCFASDEDRSWWSDLWAERITQSPLATQAIADAVATEDALRSIAAAWRRWGQDPDGWFSVPSAEIICRAAPDTPSRPR